MPIVPSLLCPLKQAGIEFVLDGVLVEVLTYEDNLLQTVSVVVVPVAVDARVVDAELSQLVLRHGGIPLSGILQLHLATGLLKDIAEVRLVLKPAQALGADDALRPAAGYEVIEEVDVKRLASVVDVCADAVLLYLARLLVVVMVVMAAGALAAMMMSAMLVVLIVVIMMMLMMVVLMLVMIVMMMLVLLVFVIAGVLLYLRDPCC